MTEDDFHKEKTISGLPNESKPPIPTTDIPKAVGPYKIESLLEKGGMSILYLATHPNTKEPTTIKVLSPRFLVYPEAVQRFLNEAEIIAMTDHPNIVKLYGHGEWEGGLYIAMEFIQGISLRQAILQNPISLKRSLEIIIDIAYALCHLHTHGVIHRDLKPENILITESNQIKVIDFGIAQMLTEKPSTSSPPKPKFIGTPIYMSPEQRENPESVSYPSDIYSLGIISYEIILGKLSHGQIHLSLMPKGIQKILNKTLQPKPEDRYQDVVDFITDISTYLNSPSMEKEKKVGDQITELSENLRIAQNKLTPSTLPTWDCLELGLATHKTRNASCIYYDFIAYNEDSFVILIGESPAKGAEGIVNTAIAKGLILGLQHLANQPTEFMSKLNTLLIQDCTDQILTLALLFLSPKDNTLKYIACGYNQLWRLSTKDLSPTKITAKNIALGIDNDNEFKAITTPWEIGDLLILNSFAVGITENPIEGESFENFFKRYLGENHQLPPQKIIDAILRKISNVITKAPSEHTPLLIAIRRIK